MFNVNSLNRYQRIALLYGIMAGDGCLSLCTNKKGKTCHFISISGNYYDDKPFFNEVVLPLVNSLRSNKVDVKFRERPKYGKIEINFIDRELFELIHSYGFPVGKKGQNLLISSLFYRKNLIRYIMQGFMATDGSLVLTKNPNKFYPRVEAMVIHKEFLKQVYDYLISMGLKGAYYKRKSKTGYGWKTGQDQYRFQFNGKGNLLLFEKLVGFINPKQRAKFNNFLNYDIGYDYIIKDKTSLQKRVLKNDFNIDFIRKMATPRVELGTSCS